MSEILKSVELRLLRCTLPPTQHLRSPNSVPNPLLEVLIDSIERGNYSNALTSPAACLVFKFAESFEFEDSVESANRFYSEVERSVEAFLRNNKFFVASEAWLSVLDEEGDEDDSRSEMEVELRFAIVMCLGVAALLAFTHQNVTGPVGVFSPFPISFVQLKKDKAVNSGEMWDIWARNQLTSVGCGLLGKFMHLQYIVYGKILLSKVKDLSMEGKGSCLGDASSISWWLCRLILLQQRISDELVSSLYDLLQVCKREILNQFGELDYVINYWGSLLCEGEASIIVSMAQLEAGIIEHNYSQVDSSRLHLEHAEGACGMHHSVTGVLGFRTIHQVDATAQLVLVPNTDNQVNGGGQSTKSPQTGNYNPASEDKMNMHPHECSDVLIKPRLLERNSRPNGNFSGIGNNNRLSATQQAVILAQCLHLQSRSRSDELSRGARLESEVPFEASVYPPPPPQPQPKHQPKRRVGIWLEGKVAVAGMVKSAAAELSKKGVRVNCISPFAVATRMTVEQFEMIFQGLEREKVVKIIDGLGGLSRAKCEDVDVAKLARLYRRNYLF